MRHDTTGIDEVEVLSRPLSLGVESIAGYTRLGLHDGVTLLNDAIEQGRLPYVRTTDDGNKTHRYKGTGTDVGNRRAYFVGGWLVQRIGRSRDTSKPSDVATVFIESNTAASVSGERARTHR